MTHATGIRLATTEDAPRISALATRLSWAHVLTDQPPAGVDKLLVWMSPDAVAGRIAAGHRHHVAEVGAVLAGAIGTRDDSHVHLLFVDDSFQRRGIARALWQVARDACVVAANPERITVNASAFAVAAYRRLGFVDLGPQQQRDDVIATPMAYRLR